jgi:hypothetical protein
LFFMNVALPFDRTSSMPPWPAFGPALLVVLLIGCDSREGQVTSPDAAAPARSHAQPVKPEQDGDAAAVSSSAKLVERSSLDFSYRNGEEAGHFAILESLGGGVAFLDYDADGDMDLFFTGGGDLAGPAGVVGHPSALARNESRWRFSLVAEKAGAAVRHYSHGAAAADLNDDGWTDVAVTGYGGLQVLYNRGDGTFDDATERSGLDDTLWSSSAAIGDVNGDSIPDLYVAHYVDWSLANNPVCTADGGERDVCPPKPFQGLSDTLYLGNGDETFRDASARAGLRSGGKGLGTILADLDLDGDLDIYVTNDTEDNFLYENEGQGRFTEIGAESGAAFNDRGRPDGSMGVDVGDFNLDGLPDLWVANYERESFALYRNEGRLLFQHVSRATGVTAGTGTSVGWGTVFLDFDRDGDQDVFVSNGHILRHPRHAPARQPPLLFENVDSRFHDVAASAGEYFADSHNARGAAAGDLDDDGASDLAVSRVNAPVAILANESPGGQWISLRLIGTAGDRNASGAIVTVATDSGRQVRQVAGGGSYASTNDSRLLFGLGEAERATITVRWPHHGVTTEYELPGGRVYYLIEPTAGGAPRPARAGARPSAASATSALRAPA